MSMKYFFIILIFAFSKVIGDTIVLKNGKKIYNVKSSLDGNRIKITHADGKITYYSKSQIDSLEPGRVIPIEPEKIPVQTSPSNPKISLKEVQEPPKIIEKVSDQPLSPEIKLESKQFDEPNKFADKDLLKKEPFIINPYLSLLPFYSASFQRNEFTEGSAFVFGKLYSLLLYSRYKEEPKDYVSLRENVFLLNTFNRNATGNLTDREILVRLNYYQELQKDTLDPFTHNIITKDQFENRRKFSIIIFTTLTFLDFYLNNNWIKKYKSENRSFKFSPVFSIDPLTKSHEIGLNFSFQY